MKIRVIIVAAIVSIFFQVGALAGTTAYQPVPTIAALAGYSQSTLFAHVAENNGDYRYYSTSVSAAFAPQNQNCPAAIDGYWYVAVTGHAATDCWVLQSVPAVKLTGLGSVAPGAGVLPLINGSNPGITYEQYGAYGDGQRRYDCVSDGYLTVTCPGGTGVAAYTFTSADIGKIISIQWAGATLTGAQNHPFISTIAGVSAGNAILAAPVTNPASGPAGSGHYFVKFGHDDTAAIIAANTATLGLATCVSAGSHKNYLVTGQITFGGTANVPHCFKLNNAGFDSVLSNNTTDNFVAQGVRASDNGTYPGMSLWPLYFENGYFDCGDTGQDCFTLKDSAQTTLFNVKINNSFRNGFAIKPVTWVDGLNLNNFIVMNSGHHAFYAWLNPAYQANGPYFNVVNAGTVQFNTFGLNSCAILHAAGGPTCPWSGWSSGDKTTYNIQLGAAMYFINGVTSGPFSWQTYKSVAIQPGSALAQAWGSNINPNAVVYADGTQAHLIEGAGVVGASLGVKAFSFENVDTEDANNFYSPTPAYGGSYCFRGETAAVDALVMQHSVLHHVGSAYCDSRQASWGNINGNIYGGANGGGNYNALAGDVLLGNNNLTTSSTTGFVWIPSTPTSPVSTVTAEAGSIPMLFDIADGVPCFASAAWKCGNALQSGLDFTVGRDLLISGSGIKFNGAGSVIATPGIYVQGTTLFFVPPASGYNWVNAANNLVLASLSNAGVFSLPQVAATGTGDVPACFTTGFAITKGSVCGTSLEETKNIHSSYHVNPFAFMALDPITFQYKTGGQEHLGFGARKTTSVEPLCGAYDRGKLRNYEDRCIAGMTVSMVQFQQWEIYGLLILLIGLGGWNVYLVRRR